MRFLASLMLLTGLVLAACVQPAASPSPSASGITPSPTASATATPSATSPAPSPTQATVPGVVRPTQVPLPNDVVISAPSSASVWALIGGAVLYRSADRGTTWEQRGLPPVGLPRSISFQSGIGGWVTTVDPAGGACPGSFRIWETADGGATYREIRPTGLTGNACDGALGRVNATTAFLTGGGNETASFVYRTTDGGLTWTALTPPSAAGAPAGALSPGTVRPFGTTLLMAVIDWRNTPPQRAVYRSTDNGTTWSFAAAIPTGIAPPSVGLATATRWLVLGEGPGTAQETTDGGVNWHAYTTDYQQAAPVGPALYFADESIGYATVRGSIQRTIDGGAHWTPLTTPGT